jgi:hypothetical protein
VPSASTAVACSLMPRQSAASRDRAVCQAEPVARFDADLYLRALAERQLATDGLESTWRGPLDSAAQALVAVGAISPDAARAVLADYGVPEAPAPAAAAEPLPRYTRMVTLDADVPAAEGVIHLRYATFDERGISIAARYLAHPEHRGRRDDWIRVPSNLPSGLAPLVVGDDRGTEVPLQFSGSGNDDRWSAMLGSEHARVAPDTAWLALYGVRVACRDATTSAEISIEPTADADPARAHLWRRLTTDERAVTRSARPPFVDALVAAGALAADDPDLDRFAALRHELPGPFGDERPVRQMDPSMPEPWASLLRRRGRTDGPSGILQIGAETPAFDDHRVGVDVLESGPRSFTVVVRESPRASKLGHETRAVEDRQVIWWARDDHGNHYLAHADNHGDQTFRTPLDPRATRLDLLPTTVHGRAVISIPLRWETSDA